MINYFTKRFIRRTADEAAPTSFTESHRSEKMLTPAAYAKLMA